MSAPAFAVMAWPKISASVGWAWRYGQSPSGATCSSAGEPVRTECCSWPSVAVNTGRHIIREKARMDRG